MFKSCLIQQKSNENELILNEINNILKIKNNKDTIFAIK